MGKSAGFLPCIGTLDSGETRNDAQCQHCLGFRQGLSVLSFPSFRRKPESRVLYCKDSLGSRFRGNDGIRILKTERPWDFGNAISRTPGVSVAR